MNENLSAALLRAGLTVEDVAARLEVDPKTVRRWLDGRVPFLRHRWALAGMLSAEEMDLWPGLRAAPSRPADVRAIYPRLDAVPREVWLSMLGSAEREIDILDSGALPFSDDHEVMAVLGQRARAGVRMRICFAVEQEQLNDRAVNAEVGAAAASSQGESGQWDLGEKSNVQIRRHRTPVYNTIYRADDELLISHRVYGVQAGGAGVLWLQHGDRAALAPMFLAELERIWEESSPTRHRLLREIIPERRT